MPMHNGWGAMYGMGFLWIVLLVVGVLVAIWLIRTAASTGAGPRPRSTASFEDILKERYARGEIEREEYQRRLEDLRR